VGLDDRLTALLWTSSGEELLLNQLVVKALIDTGYSRVYNRLININPLKSKHRKRRVDILLRC